MRRCLPALALVTILAACAGPRAGGTAAAPAAEVAAATPAAGATASVSIPVNGMHCGSCSRRVTTALKALDGVVSAEVLLAERRAVVTYAPGRIDPAALAAAIREAGYQPGDPTPL